MPIQSAQRPAKLEGPPNPINGNDGKKRPGKNDRKGKTERNRTPRRKKGFGEWILVFN
jgi:hypothetical protein